MDREFSKILVEFLISEEITQKIFAQSIGVKPSQVSEWIKGKSKPGYDNLQKIASVYPTLAEYLLGLADTYWMFAASVLRKPLL